MRVWRAAAPAVWLCLAGCPASSGPAPETDAGVVDRVDDASTSPPAPDVGMPRSLDRSFGDGGKVLTSITGCPASLDVLPDGRLLFGGNFRGSGLVRLTATGAPDPTFGKDGVGVAPALPNVQLGGGTNAVRLDDGRTIVALAARPQMGAGYIVLVRYLMDGTLDPSFGEGGAQALHLDPMASQRATSLAIWSGPDGPRLIIAGLPDSGEGGVGPLVIRTDLDGKPDPTFASGGWVVRHLEAAGTWTPAGLAVLPDGKLLLAGSVLPTTQGNDFALLRLTADGALDDQFGRGGIATTAFGDGLDDRAMGMAVQSDGAILVAGDTHCLPLVCLPVFAVARFAANGSLDPTFGDQGHVRVQRGAAQVVRPLADGIFLGGVVLENREVDLGGGGGRGSPQDFAALRLRTTGAVDESFGTSDIPGVEATSFGAALTRSSIEVLAVQPDGKVLGAGCVGSFAGGDAQLGVVRYQP